MRLDGKSRPKKYLQIQCCHRKKCYIQWCYPGKQLQIELHFPQENQVVFLHISKEAASGSVLLFTEISGLLLLSTEGGSDREQLNAEISDSVLLSTQMTLG